MISPDRLRHHVRELRSRVERIQTATPADNKTYQPIVAPLLDAAWHLQAAANALQCVNLFDDDQAKKYGIPR